MDKPKYKVGDKIRTSTKIHFDKLPGVITEVTEDAFCRPYYIVKVSPYLELWEHELEKDDEAKI